MDEQNPTERVIEQGRALVRAIEALGTIQSTRPFESAISRLLVAAYKRRLRAIVSAAPKWVGEQILSAAEYTSDSQSAP